ncbi:MAG: DNA sulfur modification protein DndB [Moraxellaceae bacterium]|nr:DNA sulfur modification protein DndB [Moraxellaceae bacterium]
MEPNNYQFTAMRGVQAGRAYYVLMCPLRLVPKLFRFDDEALPPELRAQRVLNRVRVPQISRYIVEHLDEYILSSLCASVDGEIEFLPIDRSGPLRSIGTLRIGMSATILINDGQHRRAAIEEALQERPELGEESISIVLFADRGLIRSQQMFADLNVHAIRPTKSIRLLYDHRDEMAKLVRQIIQLVPLFRQFTDLEKTSISNRSLKLFTLSSLHQATLLLLKKSRTASVEPGDLEKCVDFWSIVIGNMPDWQNIAKKTVLAHELRRDYIHAHGIALQAIALAGAQLQEQRPSTWKQDISQICLIDWSRANVAAWEGRALIGGKINKSSQSVTLVANAILKHLDVPLTSEGARLEALAPPLLLRKKAV